MTLKILTAKPSEKCTGVRCLSRLGWGMQPRGGGLLPQEAGSRAQGSDEDGLVGDLVQEDEH